MAVKKNSLKNLRPQIAGQPAPANAGRKKLADTPWRPLSEDVKKLLDDMTDVVTKTADGKTLVQEKTFREQILRKLMTKAANGDLRAMEILFDRTEGKPSQALQLSGEVKQDVNIIQSINSFLNETKSEMEREGINTKPEQPSITLS